MQLAPIHEMVRGEYESMKALYDLSPHMVPQPLGYGTCELAQNNHFFLCEFIELYDELPDIVDFCGDVADIHFRSIAKSDNGMFGFHVTTCNGTVPQRNSWNSSWEAFYIQALQHEFELEKVVHGPHEEIERLLPELYEKVCPRLLRPLETEDRTLRPCLVHGDLWDGNVAVHVGTGQAYIYDSSAFWAHNEYEMNMWRGERFKMRRAFVKEYFSHFPISSPVEDWDDRNLLYSLRADLHDSILFPSTTSFRELMLATMRTLVDKFPEGYTGTAHCKASMISQSGGSSPDHSVVQTNNNHSGSSTNNATFGAKDSHTANDARLSIEGLVQNHLSFSSKIQYLDTSNSTGLPPREDETDIALGESAISRPESSIASGD